MQASLDIALIGLQYKMHDTSYTMRRYDYLILPYGKILGDTIAPGIMPLETEN